MMWEWLHRLLLALLCCGCVTTFAFWFGWKPDSVFAPTSFGNSSQIGDRCIRLYSTSLNLRSTIQLRLTEIVSFDEPVNKQEHSQIFILGIGYWSAHDQNGRSEFPPARREYWVCVEYWLLVFLTGIYPVLFFIRSYRRRRAHRQALQPCGQCGYDLTGNESGSCSECGTVITRASNTEVAG